MVVLGGAKRRGEAEAVAQFLEYRVDGLILTGPRLSSSQLLDIAAETRLAIIGTTVDTDKLDSVNNDERRGALRPADLELVVHLLADEVGAQGRILFKTAQHHSLDRRIEVGDQGRRRGRGGFLLLPGELGERSRSGLALPGRGW